MTELGKSNKPQIPTLSTKILLWEANLCLYSWDQDPQTALSAGTEENLCCSTFPPPLRLELLEAANTNISIKPYADIFLNINTFLHVYVHDICAFPNVWVHIGMQGCVCVLVPGNGIFLDHCHLIYGNRIFHLKPDWTTSLLDSCSGHPISVSPSWGLSLPPCIYMDFWDPTLKFAQQEL